LNLFDPRKKPVCEGMDVDETKNFAQGSAIAIPKFNVAEAIKMVNYLVLKSSDYSQSVKLYSLCKSQFLASCLEGNAEH
jgi:hypothetical protein